MGDILSFLLAVELKLLTVSLGRRRKHYCVQTAEMSYLHRLKGVALVLYKFISPSLDTDGML